MRSTRSCGAPSPATYRSSSSRSAAARSSSSKSASHAMPTVLVELVEAEQAEHEVGLTAAVQPHEREPLAPHRDRLGVDGVEDVEEPDRVHPVGLRALERRGGDELPPVEAQDVLRDGVQLGQPVPVLGVEQRQGAPDRARGGVLDDRSA